MPEVSLDHVQIPAPPGSEPAARRFFGKLLGLAEIEKPGERRFYSEDPWGNRIEFLASAPS